MNIGFISIPLEILHRYAGKRLVVKGYDSDPENDFFAGDFLNLDNIQDAFSQIESGEGDLSYEGSCFFKESFWNLIVEPKDIIASLRESGHLYDENELKISPFPILFSQIPNRETLDCISNVYRSDLQLYIETCSLRMNNISRMQEIDAVFERFGYTSLRNWQYRIIFPNYWFHIFLNKKDFVFEFEPFIAMAPLVEDDPSKQPYHEWHEQTKRFKGLQDVRLAAENSEIDPVSLNAFEAKIEALLVELNEVTGSEDKLLKYLDTAFKPII